jgi:hypothetical protein
MLKDKFVAFNSYLENCNKIDCERIKSKINMSLVPKEMLVDDMKFIEESTKIIIPENDFDFFRISSDSLCWSYTNVDNQFIYGGFIINGYLESLAQDSDFWEVYNSINKYEPCKTELDLLKKLNWFEKQSWGDDGRFGCFLREPSDFPQKIYFYDNGACFPTALNLEKYFDAMIASCAIRGWQYFYIDIPDDFPELPKVNKNLVLQDAGFIVEMLPRLFPDMDFSYHEKRLKYLKDKFNN